MGYYKKQEIESGYADPSYSKSNVDNYYLLTFLGSVLGEASSTADNLVAFSDDSVDNQGSYAVFVYKDYVNIVDDGSCLSDKNMYQIIGYCQFHGIEYKINKWKDAKELIKMSDLLLKTQQELHENTTKWNRVVEK